MGTHEVIGKHHVRSSSQNDDDDVDAGEAGWTRFEPGDEITPTEAELNAFPERFRELRSSSDESVVEVPLDLGDMTVGEVAEELDSGEYDDKLDILEEAESQGDERTGVFDAIDERRE